MREPFNHWERWFLPGLIVLSIGLRVVFLSQVYDNPFFNNPTSDAYYYDAQAQSIAGGDVLGRDVFFRAPGYPYLLGLIYATFGHSYLTVRIIQHLLGVAALVLLYLLAHRLFNPTVAAVAAVLMALYPVLMYFEGQLLFDSFLTLLCLSWLLLLCHTRETPVVRRWLLVGFLYGLICVTRPTFLPFTVPLFGYEIWRWFKRAGKGKALLVAGALTTGIALSILPVTIRHYVVASDAVLISSQGGINFFIGNNPKADGYTARIPTDAGASWEIAEMSLYVERVVGHRRTPSEESSFWYAKGMEFIYHQPVHFAALLIKEVLSVLECDGDSEQPELLHVLAVLTAPSFITGGVLVCRPTWSARDDLCMESSPRPHCDRIRSHVLHGNGDVLRVRPIPAARRAPALHLCRLCVGCFL